MRRSIFLGILLTMATALHADLDNSIKKESLISSSEKGLFVDSSSDSMIANEAVEAPDSDKEELLVTDATEESEMDIDSLIMEAENALKEELGEDSAISGQKRVFLQYDSADAPFMATETPKAQDEAARVEEEVAGKAASQGTMQFSEVPIDALSKPSSLMQEPFIEITLDDAVSFEEAPQYTSPEAQIVAPSPYEVSKEAAPDFSTNEELAAPTTLVTQEAEKLSPILEEAPITSSEVSLEKQMSITSIPTNQAIAQEKSHQSFSKHTKNSINLQEVFSGSPVIYTLLLFLSIASIALFFYHYLYLRVSDLIPSKTMQSLQTKISQQQYLEAKAVCLLQDSFFFKMIASGITVKDQTLADMVETMKNEGKKHTIPYWQRLGLLNDIAIIAPMVGLLGTVLGMFYAFYDINNSTNALSSLFDGLGVSVGTTVVGLMVAIMAMIFHSLCKYRLMRILSFAETQSEQFAHLIKASTMQGIPVEGGNDATDTR